MPLDADALIDRHRLKRRLTLWRVVAILAVVLAVGVALPHGGKGGAGAHIERYRIAGLIGDGHETIEDIGKLAGDPAVKAVLLHLDTPGGEVAGGEGIHDAVLKLAAKKPVVAVMDGTAASAGYMIAVAAPHIVARDSTITGSIGVIMEAPNFGGLLAKIGVSIDPLVSGPLKGQPSLDRPMTPEARAVLQAMIGDLYDQFVGIVAAGRHMDAGQVRTLADGRAYTGRQALKLGLVDEIGGEDEARAWLESKRNVPANLPISQIDKRSWLQKMQAEELSTIVTGMLHFWRVDGALALWQPQGA